MEAIFGPAYISFCFSVSSSIGKHCFFGFCKDKAKKNRQQQKWQKLLREKRKKEKGRRKGKKKGRIGKQGKAKKAGKGKEGKEKARKAGKGKARVRWVQFDAAEQHVQNRARR